MSKTPQKRDAGRLPYRPCVGIALFNEDGRVWIGKRTDIAAEGEGKGLWWQMPQGGVDDDEPLYRAALRELYEETSVRSVERLAEIDEWLYYDLPPQLIPASWGGRYRGQKQKWFALRFTGKDSEIEIERPGGGKHKAEFTEWRWEKLARLPELIVPFKRDVYEQVVKAFAGVAG